jgi:glutaredoxin-like protein
MAAILTKYWPAAGRHPYAAPCRFREGSQERRSQPPRSDAMLQNREGQRVPAVTFRVRQNNEWKSVTTDDLFAGKTVVVFSLPGAFTPTCSSTHLPRYNELAPAFFANGVDSIVCVSVNDTFVMNEWAKDQESSNVVLVPDGNGEFTAGMGMLVDKADLGFGKRSWRYSMLVRDGIVRKMFIEPEKAGDPFEVSDADTMLAYVNPKAKKPDQVAIFTRDGCQFCAKAKALLTDLGYEYAEVPLAHNERSRIVGAVTGEATVPQVFINGGRIGGLEALERWARKAA